MGGNVATIRDLPRVASPHPTPPRLTYCSHAVLIPFPVPCLLCSRSANQANYSALHGLPLYMNQINTAILRIVSGNDDLSITTTMHPMPRETCVDLYAFLFYRFFCFFFFFFRFFWNAVILLLRTAVLIVLYENGGRGECKMRLIVLSVHVYMFVHAFDCAMNGSTHTPLLLFFSPIHW